VGRQVSAGGAAPDALEVIGLTKRFGRTLALDDVSLTVLPAEIHALLGHNGSGKSTLVKLLSGYHTADQGTLRFGGREMSYPASPATFRELGVGFVHQDIGLVHDASVAENMLVGRFSTGFLGRIRWGEGRARLRRLLDSFDLSIDLEARVSSLSASQRTLIGLLRAFQDMEGRESGLLVLDEVTAALPAEELGKVFDTVGRIKARGIAVLMITHHLSEPLLLADRVSVLRDGRLMATEPVAGQTEAGLAALVLGEDRNAVRVRPLRALSGDPVLEVRAASGHLATDVSFSLRRGEVIGLTGLAGSGHDEVPHLLYGTLPGRVELVVDGKTIDKPSPNRSLDAGMALVSGDRATSGGVLPATLAENLSAPVLQTLTGLLHMISPRRERALVSDLLSRFGIRPSEPGIAFSALSGGNQQKALLGRWMASHPKVMLLDEPTSGVDIGAVDSILQTLEEYVSQGGGIVIASTQYEDLIRIADRVLVFHRGRIVEELAGEGVTSRAMLTGSYQAEREAVAS
jgi:ribose transport system ATP-binding protein